MVRVARMDMVKSDLLEAERRPLQPTSQFLWIGVKLYLPECLCVILVITHHVLTQTIFMSEAARITCVICMIVGYGIVGKSRERTTATASSKILTYFRSYR